MRQEQVVQRRRCAGIVERDADLGEEGGAGGPSSVARQRGEAIGGEPVEQPARGVELAEFDVQQGQQGKTSACNLRMA